MLNQFESLPKVKIQRKKDIDGQALMDDVSRQLSAAIFNNVMPASG